jgi:hypothetical protein
VIGDVARFCLVGDRTAAPLFVRRRTAWHLHQLGYNLLVVGSLWLAQASVGGVRAQEWLGPSGSGDNPDTHTHISTKSPNRFLGVARFRKALRAGPK